MYQKHNFISSYVQSMVSKNACYNCWKIEAFTTEIMNMNWCFPWCYRNTSFCGSKGLRQLSVIIIRQFVFNTLCWLDGKKKWHLKKIKSKLNMGSAWISSVPKLSSHLPLKDPITIGCAIAEADRPWPVIAETQVRSHDSPQWICGGQRAVGQVFPEYFTVSCHLSANGPYL